MNQENQQFDNEMEPPAETMELSRTALQRLKNIQHKQQEEHEQQTRDKTQKSQKLIDLGEFGQSPLAVLQRLLDQRGHISASLMQELEEDMRNAVGSREEKIKACLTALNEIETITSFERITPFGVACDPDDPALRKSGPEDDIDALVEESVREEERMPEYLAAIPTKKIAVMNIISAINEETFLLELYEKSTESYHQAERLLEKNPDKNAGTVKELLEEALASYNKILQFDKLNIDVLRNCAHITRILRQYDETKTYLEKVIDLNCDENDYVFLAIVNSIMGEKEEAARNAKIALNHNREHVPALMLCVKMRALLGDIRWYSNYLSQLEDLSAQGKVTRKEIIDLFNEIVNIKENEAEVALKQGNAEEHQRLLSEILDIDPGYNELADEMLRIRKRLLDSLMSDEFDRAAQLGMNEIEDDPQRTGMANRRLIHEAILEGEFQAAADLINKALAVDDTNQFALRELIFLYLYRLEFDKAEDEILFYLKLPNVKKDPLVSVLRFGILNAYSLMLREEDQRKRREIKDGINRVVLLVEEVSRQSAKEIRGLISRVSSNKLENY